jgi:hypothetical protein
MIFNQRSDDATKVNPKHSSIHAALMDQFINKYDEKEFVEFTDAELVSEKAGTLVFDSESYVNYFLLAFRSIQSKRITYFEDSAESKINLNKLRWILQNFCIVGFNSLGYDVPLVTLVLQGYRAADLKAFSNRIIYERLHWRAMETEFNIKFPPLNHIDLIEVAPLMASLKTYGGRLQSRRMQEFPIEHNKQLTKEEARAVKLYCFNDLEVTHDLYQELKPALDLRTQMSHEYKQDLRSRSDAQVAEEVIKSELKRLNGYYPKRPVIDPGTSFFLKVPSFINYELPQLRTMLDVLRSAKFVIGGLGEVEMPAELSKVKIPIGNSVYRMGIGGLHSSETCIAHKADENTFLIDKDVASYYPSIILNQELCPKHLGKSFLKVYKSIVDRRMEAKRTAPKGVVEQSLKITINGSFGKLGNKYSVLYAPDLLMQVTMTGQLSLLMLIEWIEKIGISVVSANTDGILVKCPKDRYIDLEMWVMHWEKITGFITEEARYKATYNRDVNNYIAIQENGKIKAKGAYTERGSSGNSVLSKNPESLICIDALYKFLTDGIPIEETVKNCKDIRRFVTVRTVKGGGEKSGVYLGKTVRWYFSKDMKGTINYVTNGNKVPNTDNAMPCMDLPTEFPLDVDFQHYIDKANEILHDIGYFEKSNLTVPSLF